MSNRKQYFQQKILAMSTVITIGISLDASLIAELLNTVNPATDCVTCIASSGSQRCQNFPSGTASTYRASLEAITEHLQDAEACRLELRRLSKCLVCQEHVDYSAEEYWLAILKSRKNFRAMKSTVRRRIHSWLQRQPDKMDSISEMHTTLAGSVDLHKPKTSNTLTPTVKHRQSNRTARSARTITVRPCSVSSSALFANEVLDEALHSSDITLDLTMPQPLDPERSSADGIESGSEVSAIETLSDRVLNGLAAYGSLCQQAVRFAARQW